MEDNIESVSKTYSQPDSQNEEESTSNSISPRNDQESELQDIYSDIETVSTSKVENDDEHEDEEEQKIETHDTNVNSVQSDEVDDDDGDNTNSELDLVIDTPEEKVLKDENNETVTSTTNNVAALTPTVTPPPPPSPTPEPPELDQDDSCPNFSIYSNESKILAKNTDLQLLNEEVMRNQKALVDSTLAAKSLYSDSDDDLVKIDQKSNFAIGDIRNLTEDISDEEERSYTPCLDERKVVVHNKVGNLEGLEAISEDEKNDFDEAKTVNDVGDALEINAKENELDFTKPEDYEEGEIVDKSKKQLNNNECKDNIVVIKKDSSNFKKLSKSNKERNYRCEKRSGSESSAKNKENDDNKSRKERKKSKRKDLERYNVRSIVSEKPRRDKFGRDARRRSSSSSLSPYRSRKRSRSRSRKRRRRNSSKRRSSRKKSSTRKRSPSPSWTPPRNILDKQTIKPHNLKVILTNDASSNNRKSKRNKSEKKKYSDSTSKVKKRKRERTPLPNKEVFASGDNILVSVSFNKDEKTRETTVQKKKQSSTSASSSSQTQRSLNDNDGKKSSSSSVTITKRKKPDLSTIKPVAIIDLDRSPFKELTPSPKDIIVLSDSDNNETSAKESNLVEQGPKTPPEPQVKFQIAPKVAQIRAITNPLEEPEEEDPANDSTPTNVQQAADVVKGPNTPPEPPNSPGSCSPDAYDPFDPTKSPDVNVQSNSQQADDDDDDDDDGVDNVDNCADDTNDSHNECFEAVANGKSTASEHDAGALSSSSSLLALPSTDIQPADSQSNSMNDASKTPERTIITTSNVSAPVGSATLQTSPVKATLLFKSTTIVSNTKTIAKKKSNSNHSNDSNMDLESPYSPGPSDYEDLFEPPTQQNTSASSAAKSSSLAGNATKANNSSNIKSFDALFGSSSPPSSSVLKSSSKAATTTTTTTTTTKAALKSLPGGMGAIGKKPPTPSKVKMVGVKIDEDSLRIIDELPNSAVEMQVKDKFLKKLNRQERVVEEVKLVLKPHYNKKHINKEEYKDILRRAVPKICHNKSGEINPKKIQNLIEAYVKKFRHHKKVTSSSSINTQK